jgi:hypothetical protein
MKFHNTACRISLETENMSWSSASFKSSVACGSVLETLTLRNILIGQKLQEFKPGHKGLKNKKSPW